MMVCVPVGRLSYVLLWVSCCSNTLFQIFTGISPESSEFHQNFARISNWSTSTKGTTATQPSHIRLVIIDIIVVIIITIVIIIIVIIIIIIIIIILVIIIIMIVIYHMCVSFVWFQPSRIRATLLSQVVVFVCALIRM